jgi:hypothetical protein
VPTFKVTGKVTMQGAPIADAVVTFSPTESQPMALGRTNAAGEYTLTTYEGGDGAAAGLFKVMVTKTTTAAGAAPAPVAGQHDTNAAANAQAQQHAASGGTPAGGKSTESLLPDRYGQPSTSGLEATVTEGGENKFDFALEP